MQQTPGPFRSCDRSGAAAHGARYRLNVTRLTTLLAAVLFCGGFWWVIGGLTVHAITGAFRREQAVEAPPAIYAEGPTQTGATRELNLPTVEAVDRICRLGLRGLPEHARRGSYYIGCYLPSADKVIIPTRTAWPSKREWETLRAHEWAHARGWRHKADGYGTDWALSLPPRAALAAEFPRRIDVPGN